MNRKFQATLPSAALFVALIILPTFSTTADAQSLFSRRGDAPLSLIADVKACRPGDLLFVNIQEQSDVENLDQRQLRKQNGSKSEGQMSYSLGGDIGAASANGTFDQETAASRDFTGNTQLRMEREFLDRFAVRVVDVQANGNMLIAGSRDLTIEGDTRRLILTGMIRAVDIDRQNTITSNKVAGLKIRFESTGINGAEDKFLNQGWLGKKLNRLWPY